MQTKGLRRIMMMTLALLLMGAAFVGIASAASTIHVSSSGDDENGDGSEGNPYLTLEKAHEVANAGDTIKLLSNITQTTEFTVTKTISLDLNGYVLTGSNLKAVINIEDAGKLELKDSNTSAIHKFSVNDTGLWVLDETNGTKTVNGGVITNMNNTEDEVTGVSVSTDSEFTMTGGNIVGNNYGGVYVDESSEFTMTEGTIQGNIADYGSGIFLDYGDLDQGDFTMTGGTIQNNKATETNAGGGVFAPNDVTIGGTAVIKGNTSGTNISDNLYLYKASSTLPKIVIDENTPLAAGADIWVTSSDVPTEGSDPITISTSENVTADDVKYFNSDNTACYIDFVTDHLVLAYGTTTYSLTVTPPAGQKIKQDSGTATTDAITISSIPANTTITKNGSSFTVNLTTPTTITAVVEGSTFNAWSNVSDTVTTNVTNATYTVTSTGYTITYDKGEAATGDQHKVTGLSGTTTLLSTVPSSPSEGGTAWVAPSGKTLAGWTIGGETYNLGGSYTIAEDVTATAIWEGSSSEGEIESVDDVDITRSNIVLTVRIDNTVSKSAEVGIEDSIVISEKTASGNTSGVTITDSDLASAKVGSDLTSVNLTLNATKSNELRNLFNGSSTKNDTTKTYSFVGTIAVGEDTYEATSSMNVTIKAKTTTTALMLSHRGGQSIDLTKLAITVTNPSGESQTISVPTTTSVGTSLEAGETLKIGDIIEDSDLKITKGEKIQVMITYDERHIIFDKAVIAQ